MFIEEAAISESKYSDDLARVSDGTLPEFLAHAKCYRIGHWRFDSAINNREILHQIFGIVYALLVQIDQAVVLWQDRDGLDWFPISCTDSACPVFVGHLQTSVA